MSSIHSATSDAVTRLTVFGYALFLQENMCTPQLLKVFVGREVHSLAAGYNHTGVVTGNGDVYMWGCNKSGQLGLPQSGACPLSLVYYTLSLRCLLPFLLSSDSTWLSIE